MSKLKEIFTKLDISQEKLKSLVNQLVENPFDAMATVQSMNIPQEVLQEVMGVVMTNPEEVKTFAKEMGISDDTIEKVQERIKGGTGGQ